MATRLPELPGGKDLAALVEVIGDAKKYKKYLGQLEAVRDDIKKYTETVGDVQQIVSLRGKAKGLLKDAEQKVAKAEDDARKILSDANSLFDARESGLVQATEKVNAANRIIDGEKRDAVRAANARESNALALANAAEAAGAKAQLAEEAARRLKDQYEEKLAKLKAAVGD